MGKGQKKTGKGRIDKYYKLAKEQGYRARSAFKLIQLNKKYAFLESAKCCIDLCAAPGGWLQVATKFMPQNSVIVGVDLVPIRPIPRVVTFASDITTIQCRNQLRGELKDWKADVVLHDGAPNVGTAWVQDAYSQSELVLMSLKLAVEFLVKGGTFVTKVFRSVDYNNLMWVFSQLFGKVEATKPPSSRNVSAEIFVVCRDFLAPKLVDPKFLDPKYVFRDLADSADKGASTNNVQANVFYPEKNRRKRDGYEDGVSVLYKSIPVSTFVRSPEPIAVLGSINTMTFETSEEKEWLTLNLTSDDVRENCKDLKVLGKGDFKTLIRWRAALREELGLDIKNKEAEEITDKVEVIEKLDEDQQIIEELERLNSEAAARTKRERRRANEIRTRTIQRMQLQMTAPLDIGLEQTDPSLSLGQSDMLYPLRGRCAVNYDEGDESGAEENNSQGSDLEDTTENVDTLEAEIDNMYDSYQQRIRERDAKFRVREGRKKDGGLEEWGGVQANQSDEESDKDMDGGWNKATERKEMVDISSDGESDDDNVPTVPKKRTLGRKTDEPLAKRKRTSNPDPIVGKAARVWFSQDIFAGVDDDIPMDEAAENLDEDVEDIENGEEDDFEIIQRDISDDEDEWQVTNEDEDLEKEEKIQKWGLTTPETVTLAQQLVNRQTTRTKLINDGFNRYSLNAKDGLPSWFLDDEEQHYKANIPVTKEAMDALRARQRALDARPIKKVAEAKARKKFKAAQKLEKAMKKAEGVNATQDISEREKAQQIDKLMRKGMSSGGKPKKEVKLVVAKGSHKGIKGRPKGVKGRYVMVDSRMKKELRAKKRKEKANKRR